MSALAGRRTVFAIEREKRWRIWLLFGMLLVVVFVSAWVACFIVTFAFFLSFPVTVTVSCLLFGIYSSLGDKLEAAALAGGGSRAIPVALAAVALRGWLWALQVASSVTNAALSRERELQADFAAARYTRDPLSLAEALRVIGRHPGGGG